VSVAEAPLLFDTDGPLAIVTFNRPEARNAITWEMYDGLAAACERVDADEALRVLVLRGAGDKAFVAGTDISQFQGFKTRDDALGYERRLDKVMEQLEAVRKPVIAALHGYAVGAGAAIALCCDLRYGTADLQLGVPIARTLGNCLSLANLARLVDAVGPARAKELIFLARLVGAEEAFAAGLLNEIVEPGRLMERVREVALQLASHAPITLRVTKEAVRRLAKKRREVEIDDLVVEAYTSADFREGVDAFLNKRKPVFRGR
jgi:enoyl-CoA hydratase/carnithine racemase